MIFSPLEGHFGFFKYGPDRKQAVEKRMPAVVATQLPLPCLVLYSDSVDGSNILTLRMQDKENDGQHGSLLFSCCSLVGKSDGCVLTADP